MSDEETDIKELGTDLKIDLKAMINKDRYKIWKNGYKFDTWIFQLTLVAIFGFLFFIAYTNNFQLDYFSCGGGRPDPLNIGNVENCKNPFYKPANWVNEEYLPPGEYGFKPGPLFNSAKYVSFGILFFAIVLNHLIYNRNFNKKIKEGFKNG